MQGRVLEGNYLKGWEKRQHKKEDNSAAWAKVWREEQKRLKEQERHRTPPNDKGQGCLGRQTVLAMAHQLTRSATKK